MRKLHFVLFAGMALTATFGLCQDAQSTQQPFIARHHLTTPVGNNVDVSGVFLPLNKDDRSFEEAANIAAGPAIAPQSGGSNPRYGRLTAAEVERINQSAVRFDMNYLRLDPSALDQKPVMQYFIALNNCNNPEIARALANELDYPALAEYYKANAAQILAALPRTVTDVALYRYIGGGQADGWRMWSKSLTLGEYNVQRRAFPIKYPGKDNVEISGSLTSDGKRDLSQVCRIASAFAGQASRYLPTVYGILFPPSSYKELPMDEAAARTYIDSAGQQRNVFLALDVTIQDTPPQITHPNNSSTQVMFPVQMTRIRVIDAKTLKSLGTLYDDHTLPAETQVAQQTPTPAPAAQAKKPGSQWAASDRLYEIRRAVYISLAADACGWPLTPEQSTNLQNFLQKVKNGKYNEKEQYYTTDTVVRNAIAQRGRANYCANAMERSDFDKAAATVAPLGPIAAPDSN